MNENKKTEDVTAERETEIKTESPQEQQPERSYTKAELDSAIAKECQSLPSDDELKAFNDWKEAQKTEQEKTAEKIRLATEAQTAAEQKSAELEAKLAAVSKGVSLEAVDDVIALAKNKVSDTVTLDQAIASIIEKYPQFSRTTMEKPVTTGISTPNNVNGAESDSLLRKAMGL